MVHFSVCDKSFPCSSLEETMSGNALSSFPPPPPSSAEAVVQDGDKWRAQCEMTAPVLFRVWRWCWSNMDDLLPQRKASSNGPLFTRRYCLVGLEYQTMLITLQKGSTADDIVCSVKWFYTALFNSRNFAWGWIKLLEQAYIRVLSILDRRGGTWPYTGG
jgi:hypothetical protein